MKFTIDKSLAELGITSVVLGIARNVDPQAPLSETFLQKQKEAENWALNCNLAEITDQPTIQGYCDLLQKVGRSVKKEPANSTSFDPQYPTPRLHSKD